MYGKVKGNFKQVLYKLGVLKYSNEDSSYSSCGEFDKQSRAVFCLKSFFYGLLIFYTLFAFTNKVSAYYVNESLSTYQDINIDSVDNYLSICEYPTLVNAINSYKDTYNMLIFSCNDYRPYIYVFCFDKNYTFELLSPSYYSNLREAYSSIQVEYGKHVAFYTNSDSEHNCYRFSYNINDDSVSSLSNSTYHSYLNKFDDYNVVVDLINSHSLINDTLYVNYPIKLYEDGSLHDLVSSTESTEPTNTTEPTNSTEPTNTIEPVVVDSSGDFVLTNNLLYYIAFMTTLGVFYNMIRNTFKRGLN